MPCLRLNLLVHLAEKILLMQTPTLGGITSDEDQKTVQETVFRTNALALMVQSDLKLGPHSGITVIVRSKRGDCRHRDIHPFDPQDRPRSRLPARLRRGRPLHHANMRGGGYYHVERTKMLTHPTHDRLLAAVWMGGLTGIASALKEQRRSPAFDDLSFEERFGLLDDREAAERDV